MTFDALKEDSRCPEGAACVWAGQVAVSMAMTLPDGKKTFPLELNGNDAARVYSAGGYRLTLRAVTPTPNVSKPTRPEDKRAELQLDAVP